MKRAIIAFVLCAVAAITVAQEPDPAALPVTADDAADGVKASTLLIVRYDWASPWDYGTIAQPIAVFSEPTACEREAQRLEAEAEEAHARPLVYVEPVEKDGKLVNAPRYVCKAITTANDREYAKLLMDKAARLTNDGL